VNVGVSDFIPNVELLDLVALLHDLADELVAADEAVPHAQPEFPSGIRAVSGSGSYVLGRAFQVSAVEVEVAAAEGGRGDLEHGIGGLLELRVGSVFHGDLRVTVSEIQWTTGRMRTL
jgi:hypothetical protein